MLEIPPNRKKKFPVTVAATVDNPSDKMMVKLVDQLVQGVQGLHIDMDKRKEETLAKQKLETQLYKLLAELVETERKYVRDLEKACDEYLPLAGKLTSSRGKLRQCHHSMSLDRSKRRKKNRSGSETSLRDKLRDTSSRQSLSGGSRSSQGSSQSNLSVDINEPEVSQREVKMMLGNIEELRDYHKHVMLPKMETAVDNAAIMRQLFEGEQSRLSRKYGRYCINNSRSSIIVDQNIKFFSAYQFKNNLELRVDAMLIKPIQRLTRYHMFLSSIAKACQELGLNEASLEFSLALESVLSAASHTNTMMWIGKMVNCPIDLPSQGQLIKHDKVIKRSTSSLSYAGSGGKFSRRWTSQKNVECHLFLFQKTLMLCRTNENLSEPNNPYLVYDNHISMNQIRVRDVIADDESTFEIHKLEHIKDMGKQTTNKTDSGDKVNGLLMRLQCESETEKNDWVKSINNEVKQLRTVAKSMSSSQMLFL